MTLTQYKKTIKSLDRAGLEEHLFALFKTNKIFKDIESGFFNPADNEELLNALTKKLERVFWKEQFSLSECKGILKDYCSRTTDTGTIALMHLVFAKTATELSATYGDYGESFYNNLISSAEKFLEYARSDKKFFEVHEEEFEKLIKLADPIGYGVADDLGMLFYDIRDDLYPEEWDIDESGAESTDGSGDE